MLCERFDTALITDEARDETRDEARGVVLADDLDVDLDEFESRDGGLGTKNN